MANKKKATKLKQAQSNEESGLPDKEEMENIRIRASWAQKKAEEICQKAGLELTPMIKWEKTGAMPHFVWVPNAEGTLGECLTRYEEKHSKAKDKKLDKS